MQIYRKCEQAIHKESATASDYLTNIKKKNNKKTNKLIKDNYEYGTESYIDKII